jgi:two-component system, cell cycle sensor histidine kinase and response regulator CckA
MKNILVVDDKVENRLLLGKLLKKNGYKVILTANGAEALAAAIKNLPDLVISDVLMPVMDGFILCRKWRKNKKLQKIPFIFYTGTYTDPKDKEFALSLGADRYIIKPQEMNNFLGMIKETIDNYRVAIERPMPPLAPKEKVLLREYNEVLVRKLKNKMTQFEAGEKELREKNAALEKKIQKHKLVEKKLRQIEEQFKLISENVEDMIAILDLDGKRIYNNLSYEPILGDVQLLKGTDSFQEIHPDDRENIRNIFQETIKTGKGQRTEYRFIKKDGSISFIESQGNVIRDDKGNVTNVVVVSRDITNRRKAEEALRKSEERYRILAEASRDLIYIIDRDDIVEYVNKSAARLLHKRPEDIIGKPLSSVVSLEVIKGQQSNLQKVIETGMPKYSEGKLVFIEQVIWLGTWFVPLRDDTGQVTAVMGVSRDITNRKWLEEDKHKLLIRLQEALAQVKTLGGLLPICSVCKKIRDDKGYWQQVEAYIQNHTDATFTHGVCPDCFPKLYHDYMPIEPKQK